MKKLISLLLVSLCVQPLSFAEKEFEKNAWKEGSKSANYDDMKGPSKGLKPEGNVKVAGAEMNHEVAGVDAAGKIGNDKNFAKGDVRVGSADAKGSANLGAHSANVDVNASVNLVKAGGEGQLSTGGENLGAGIKGSGNVELGMTAGLNSAAELSSEGLNLEGGGKVHFGPQAGGDLTGTFSLLGINFEGKAEGSVAAGLGFSGKGLINVTWTKIQFGGAIGGVVGAGGSLGTSITVDISNLVNNLTSSFDAQPWSTAEMEQVRNLVDQQISEMINNQGKDFAQQVRDLFSPKGFTDFAKQRHLEDLKRFRDELDRRIHQSANGRVPGKTDVELGPGSNASFIVLPDLLKNSKSTPVTDTSATPSVSCDTH